MTTTEPLIISEGAADETGFSMVTALISIIHSYINPIAAMIGIFSNLMSVIIFSRCKKREMSGMIQYLTLLSVFDLYSCLHFGIVNWLESGLVQYGISIKLITQSVVSCRVMQFCAQVCLMMSGWILVLFASERCIAVWLPLKLAQIVTDRRRKIALSATFAIVCLWQMKSLIFYEVYPDGEFLECFWFPEIDPNALVLLSIANKLSNVGIPCCLVTILNTAICVAVYLRTKNKTISAKGSMSAAEKRCIVNLIAICILYVVATFPTCIIWIYYNTMKMLGSANIDFTAMFRVAKFFEGVMVLNFSFNFLIYNASLEFYRNAMKRWFCFWRKIETEDVTSGQTMTSSVG